MTDPSTINEQTESIPYTFNFGKHKGRTFESMMIDNPKYLIWLYKQKWISEDLKELLAKRLDDIVIDFGRHNGQTIGDIRVNHPKYYDWLFKN